MDETDTKLLSLLRADGRASISTLSGRLGVSRATVRARMERLETRGEILGYAAILKGDAGEMPVRGVMLIGIEGKGTERIIRTLSGFPEVETIHSTNGRWDLIVDLGARTLPELDAVLQRIRLIDGVQTSETSLYLTTQRLSRRAR